MEANILQNNSRRQNFTRFSHGYRYGFTNQVRRSNKTNDMEAIRPILKNAMTLLLTLF